VCARGSNRALLGGPSTSPLDVTPRGTARFQVGVKFNASDFLFVTASYAMLLHLVLCEVVRRRLKRTGNSAMDDALFAIPNRWLNPPGVFRLLRLRYFLPFLALPSDASGLEPWVRTTLLAARVCAFYFACALVGVIALQIIEN
jgi:hypothetical protein